ncbi:nitrate- and nitrite sensing domain-containing protein [Actinomadura madurae]|uniref:nitrate- and nitrite sensing domain-containing protein n=1 Tax=Actinomadura madurae TaxID=1993 RepID=UPI0020D254B9|nr:nitrate- and nitrite sensing domain-containing protein [Actinomadura madurae]MCQ0005046.1 nitrate- and nitrite sensing domain-containing protein [Actinomadura madurae]
MRPRFSSIRARISLLVVVPLLALASLWAFLTGITYGDAHVLLQSRKFQEKTVLPAQRLIDAVQKERRLSTAELGGAQTVDLGVMRTQRQATDKAAEEVRAGGRDEGLRDSILPETVRRIDALVQQIGALEGIRSSVDERVADRAHVLRRYNAIVDAAFAVYLSATPGDGRIVADTRTLIAVGRAREFMNREDALLTGALASGHITAAERGEFAQLVGAQRTLYADNALNLPEEARAGYQKLVASPQFIQLRRLEDEVIGGADPPARAAARRTRPPAGQAGAAGAGRAARGSGPRTLEPAVWRSVADTANGRLYKFENRTLDEVVGRAQGVAIDTFGRLAVAGRARAARHPAVGPDRGAGVAAVAARVPHARGPASWTSPGSGCRCSPSRSAPAVPPSPSPLPTSSTTSPRSGRSPTPSTAPARPCWSPPRARSRRGAGSARCSSTSRAATRRCCTGSSACSTAWSAAPRTPRSCRTCSASTTSRPACGGTPRAW